jgi:hypothetical protein
VPPHAHQRAAVARPVPVDAPVERVGERADLALAGVGPVEVLLAGERAGQEQRRVDGRELDALEAQAGGGDEEVVEEPLMAGHAGRLRPLRQPPEEAQRGQRARARLGARHPAALHAHG